MLYVHCLSSVCVACVSNRLSVCLSLFPIPFSYGVLESWNETNLGESGNETNLGESGNETNKQICYMM